MQLLGRTKKIWSVMHKIICLIGDLDICTTTNLHFLVPSRNRSMVTVIPQSPTFISIITNVIQQNY